MPNTRKNPAPIVDSALAARMAGERNPVERILDNQHQAMFLRIIAGMNSPPQDGRLVQLACQHFVVTSAVHAAACPRCGEMIRAGYDHDAFRNLGQHDDFSWPGDPLRTLHEPRA